MGDRYDEEALRAHEQCRGPSGIVYGDDVVCRECVSKLLRRLCTEAREEARREAVLSLHTVSGELRRGIYWLPINASIAAINADGAVPCVGNEYACKCSTCTEAP